MEPEGTTTQGDEEGWRRMSAEAEEARTPNRKEEANSKLHIVNEAK